MKAALLNNREIYKETVINLNLQYISPSVILPTPRVGHKSGMLKSVIICIRGSI